MRKTMKKQITKTIIKSATMKLVDGIPVAEPIEDLIMLGNVKMDKAQREIDKLYDNAIVLEVEPKTEIYEMLVEDFMKWGKLRRNK